MVVSTLRVGCIHTLARAAKSQKSSERLSAAEKWGPYSGRETKNGGSIDIHPKIPVTVSLSISMPRTPKLHKPHVSKEKENETQAPSPFAHVLGVGGGRAARVAVIPIRCSNLWPWSVLCSLFRRGDRSVHTMDIAHGTDILGARHAPPVVAAVLVAQQVAVFGAFAVEDGFAALIDFGEGGVREEADVDFGVFAVEAGGFVGDVAGAGDVAGGWAGGGLVCLGWEKWGREWMGRE